MTVRNCWTTNGGPMETMERVEPAEAPLDKQILTLKKRDRWLAWLAGILAVAVLAMGAWMIFGDDGGESLTAEQEQMIKTVDEALVAWNAGDGDALAALYMPSGYHDNGSQKITVAGGALANYVEMVHGMGFSVETVETYVIDNYVISGGHTPIGSEDLEFGVHAMSNDGKKILWHLAP